MSKNKAITALLKYFSGQTYSISTEQLFALKHAILRHPKNKFLIFCYSNILAKFGSEIAVSSYFETLPIFPHKFFGIFISNGAKIGKNCVIFHQVTIGSNTLADSENKGYPTIGDNVYIGCGAKIIGNIKIGNNCRIGANTTVVKNIPDNSTVVSQSNRIIYKENMNNEFVSFKDLFSKN